MGTLSLVSGLALYVFETRHITRSGVARKKFVVLAAFLLGIILTVFLVDSLASIA